MQSRGPPDIAAVLLLVHHVPPATADELFGAGLADRPGDAGESRGGHQLLVTEVGALFH